MRGPSSGHRGLSKAKRLLNCHPAAYLDFSIHLWQARIKPRVLWSVQKRVVLMHVVVAARLDSDCPDDELWRRQWECMSNTIIFSWIYINSDIWNLGLCTIKMEDARYGIHLHDGFHKAFSQVVVTTNGEPDWIDNLFSPKVSRLFCIHEIVNQYFRSSSVSWNWSNDIERGRKSFRWGCFSLTRWSDCKAVEKRQKAKEVSFLISTNYQRLQQNHLG